MFNGIIYNTGTVQYINEDKSNCLIGVKTNLNFGNKDIGASVSCNGVCLTITKTSFGTNCTLPHMEILFSKSFLTHLILLSTRFVGL